MTSVTLLTNLDDWYYKIRNFRIFYNLPKKNTNTENRKYSILANGQFDEFFGNSQIRRFFAKIGFCSVYLGV